MSKKFRNPLGVLAWSTCRPKVIASEHRTKEPEDYSEDIQEYYDEESRRREEEQGGY